MESESKVFSIGQWKFPYDDKDPIFQLEGPCGVQTIYNCRGDGTGDCVVCKEAFKSVADINYW